MLLSGLRLSIQVAQIAKQKSINLVRKNFPKQLLSWRVTYVDLEESQDGGAVSTTTDSLSIDYQLEHEIEFDDLADDACYDFSFNNSARATKNKDATAQHKQRFDIASKDIDYAFLALYFAQHLTR